MKTIHLLFFLIFLLFTFSCKKSNNNSDTSDEYNCVVEDADLILGIDNAETLFPPRYNDDIDLLFMNEKGDSLVMEKSFTMDSIVVSMEEFTCQGTTQSLEIKQAKKRVVFISNHPEINIRLDIIVEAYASLTNWEFQPREMLTYYPARTNDLVPYGVTNIITYENGEIIATLSENISEIELNGRIFRNVSLSTLLKNNIEYKLYYTKNQGIIGMDMPSGESWYFNSFIE